MNWGKVGEFFAIRSRQRRWVYLCVLAFESLIGLWGISDLGLPAAYRSIVVVVLLLIQFFWPTLPLWVALLAFYARDLVMMLATTHDPDYYRGLVFYLIPCAALLWAMPRKKNVLA
jgi:hypothetical protein